MLLKYNSSNSLHGSLSTLLFWKPVAVKIISLLIIYQVVLELIGSKLDMGTILLLAAVLDVGYFVMNIWDHYLSLSAIKMAHKLTYDIRINLSEKLRKLSMAFLSRRSTVELNTTMSEYISRVENFISYMEPFFLSFMLSAIALIIFFLILNWRMAFTAVSVIPLAIIAFVYADIVAQRMTKESSGVVSD